MVLFSSNICVVKTYNWHIGYTTGVPNVSLLLSEVSILVKWVELVTSMCGCHIVETFTQSLQVNLL